MRERPRDPQRLTHYAPTLGRRGRDDGGRVSTEASGTGGEVLEAVVLEPEGQLLRRSL